MESLSLSDTPILKLPEGPWRKLRQLFANSLANDSSSVNLDISTLSDSKSPSKVLELHLQNNIKEKDRPKYAKIYLNSSEAETQFFNSKKFNILKHKVATMELWGF